MNLNQHQKSDKGFGLIGHIHLFELNQNSIQANLSFWLSNSFTLSSSSQSNCIWNMNHTEWMANSSFQSNYIQRKDKLWRVHSNIREFMNIFCSGLPNIFLANLQNFTNCFQNVRKYSRDSREPQREMPMIIGGCQSIFDAGIDQCRCRRWRERELRSLSWAFPPFVCCCKP